MAVWSFEVTSRITWICSHEYPARYNAGQPVNRTANQPWNIWMRPIHSGTMDTIGVLAFVNSTGGAIAPGMNIQVFEATNSADTHAQPDTASGWLSVSCGFLSASSLSMGAYNTSAQWVRVPMIPAYMSADGSTARSVAPFDGQRHSAGYAIVLRSFGVSSWGATAGAVALPLQTGGEGNAGTNGNAVLAATRHNNGVQALGKSGSQPPLYMSGLCDVSSLHGDAPLGLSMIATNTAYDRNPGTFQLDQWEFKATRFKAIGSKLTRVVADLTWDGINPRQIMCALFTDTGSCPGTLVYTAAPFNSNSHFNAVDLGITRLPAYFDFDETAINSGVSYWLGFWETQPTLTPGTVAWIPTVVIDNTEAVARNAGVVVAGSLGSGTYTAQESKQAFTIEAWFADSGNPPAPNNTGGGSEFNRLDPIYAVRLYPTGSGRLYPSP